MQQLMTVKKYAELKAISEVTVRRRIKSGEIQVERFGRAIRIVPSQTGHWSSAMGIPEYLAREGKRAD
jgi:excisionase family DNA binding protein